MTQARTAARPAVNFLAGIVTILCTSAWGCGVDHPPRTPTGPLAPRVTEWFARGLRVRCGDDNGPNRFGDEYDLQACEGTLHDTTARFYLDSAGMVRFAERTWDTSPENALQEYAALTRALDRIYGRGEDCPARDGVKVESRWRRRGWRTSESSVTATVSAVEDLKAANWIEIVEHIGPVNCMVNYVTPLW